MSRKAIAILSTDNLLHNLSVIKKQAGERKIIAMIKANAYGHGLRSTAKRLQNHVYSFGVASIDEALALREVAVKIPITLMAGVFDPDEILIATCQDFHIVIHEEIQLEWLFAHKFLPKKLKVWLKINTGMGRLGFNIIKAKEIYHKLVDCDFIEKPIGIMSHMACADNKDHPLNDKQINEFETFVSCFTNTTKSLANSATIFNYENNLYDVVRPGISLYGLSPMQNIAARSLNLKPVMTLQTRLISVKMLQKGSSVGYKARFQCPEDMPVGLISMGYGDGYPRSARDGTPVLINNVRCCLVGRVSMDIINIDLRNYPNAKVGDVVTLWGEGLPIEDVAEYTDNINYDIICSIQHRVKFYWTSSI